MRKRIVTLEKGYATETNQLTDLFIYPEYCPLNSMDINFILNPNCYEVDISDNIISICCYYDGIIVECPEDEQNIETMYCKCKSPDKPKEYFRHEHTTLEKNLNGGIHDKR